MPSPTATDAQVNRDPTITIVPVDAPAAPAPKTAAEMSRLEFVQAWISKYKVGLGFCKNQLEKAEIYIPPTGQKRVPNEVVLLSPKHEYTLSEYNIAYLCQYPDAKTIWVNKLVADPDYIHSRDKFPFILPTLHQLADFDVSTVDLVFEEMNSLLAALLLAF